MGYKGKDKRRYIRLKTVFPVLVQVLSHDKKEVISEAYQGFTKDISASGMCIRINKAKKELIESISNNKNCKISLIIEMPFFIKPINAIGNVVWMKKHDKADLDIYLIGIDYEEILLSHQRRIIRRVKLMRDAPKYTAAAIGLLLLGFILLFSHSRILKKQNTDLINMMYLKTLTESSLKSKLDSSLKDKELVLSQLQETSQKIEALRGRINNLKKEDSSNEALIAELNKNLNQTVEQKEQYDARVQAIIEENKFLKKHIDEVAQTKVVLEDRLFDIMYEYIKASQNRKTGLIDSFKGDEALGGTAFSYDQALAAQLFCIKKDYARAAKILSFYQNHAQRQDNVFYNAYFTAPGDPAEYVLHVGPNVFIGLAAIEFYKRTESKKYLPLAVDIADWIIALQADNSKGAIKGGPDFDWISTEHNVDAYALFDLLYTISKKDKYKEARDKVLGWIAGSAFNKGVHGFNRGERDAHIAADANVLTILSLGPEVLYARGIDPERVMKYTEDKCLVKVEYKRPDGSKVMVEGFDFTNYKVARRKPVISCEWTAQAIVAYKILSVYFKGRQMPDKAEYYAKKADYFLSELEKVAIAKGGIITKKGIGLPLLIMGLPYASKEQVDTGHGWATPGGKDTTSICSTIYIIYAYEGYNIFRLKSLDVGR
jgi:TolA-binding protein